MAALGRAADRPDLLLQPWQLRLDDCGERCVVGIDRERDLAGAALYARPERPRGLVAEVAGRRRKEYEADEIRARLERNVERLFRAQPADFDEETRHTSNLVLISSSWSANRRASLRATLYTITS